MTAQSTDLILIDGVQHPLFTNPLEAYREKYRPDIIFLEDAPNTSCWRGYAAEWEIDEGRLFLLKIYGNVSYKGRGPDYNIYHDKVPATLSEIFGPVSGRVPATWYSGELRIPLGEMVEYVHAGYGSRFPKYLLIPVVNGVCGEQNLMSDEEYEKLINRGEQEDSEETVIDDELLLQFIRRKKMSRQKLFMVIGALMGVFFGSSIGIAGFGSAIAGTIPIAVLGGYIGYRIGKLKT